MLKKYLKSALILGAMLTFAVSAAASEGSYYETDSLYDIHNGCLDHSAYVSGDEVLLRSGPGRNYDVVAVTKKRMHLYLEGMVRENFEPFQGRMNKSAVSFKTKYPRRFNAGDYVSIEKVVLGFNRYYFAKIGNERHALFLGDVDVSFTNPVWYKVVTEDGGSGYIYGQFVKNLTEIKFNGADRWTYKYYDSEIILK